VSFTIIATISSIAGALLGIGWLFGGKLLFSRWGIDSHSGGLLLGRRLGAVYLGIAIMLYLGRLSPASELRSALCIGMIFALATLAILGLIEFKRGQANAIILVSSAFEVLLVAGFMSVLLVA